LCRDTTITFWLIALCENTLTKPNKGAMDENIIK
jgi:hypothetical protein